MYVKRVSHFYKFFNTFLLQKESSVFTDQNTKREHGRKVQIGNVQAAKTIADVIRTCLGPRAMLKMLMDPMGGIVMTNDGNAILREVILFR